MKPSLFDNDRLTLDDAIALTAESLREHGERHRHWRVAFSGGKDSSATLTAVTHLIESGRVPRPDTFGILYADTRLELPNLQAAAMKMLAEARSRGWGAEVVYPLLDKRWFVMMLGRGIPPSHSGFRWCTGALKVDPMAEAMRQAKAKVGGKLLLITGLRVGESAARDRRISLSCGKNGGECGQGWYHETTPADVADTLAPLLHWRICHVWDWLTFGDHGFDCRAVADVYGQDAEGSAAEVLARTGCLVCPVASRDLALERTVKKPEWTYLSPMLRLRAVYDDLTLPHSRIRKNAERCADGSLSSRPMRLGPLTMQARGRGLEAVLAIQDEINTAATQLGRPKVDLINEEELARIRELVAANTWPDKWTGEEPAGDVLLPETRPDGTVQAILWGSED